MVQNQILTDQEVEAIQADMDQQVNDAVKFAENSPLPSLDSAVEDVYTDIVEEVRVR